MKRLIAGIVLAGAVAGAQAQSAQKEWEARLTAFFGGGGGNTPSVDGLAGKISSLQEAIKNCKGCADEAQIRSQLAAARGTPQQDFGDPVDEPRYTPERTVIAKMRAEGVAEDCIKFYQAYTSCERRAGGSFTGFHGRCPDDFALFYFCRKGDARKFAEAAMRRGSSQGGDVAAPRIEGDDVVFGDAPDSFNPPVPPPSFLEGRRAIQLSMNKQSVGALTQIRLQPLGEYLFAYLHTGRSNTYRPLLPDATIAQIEAIGKAAEQIKGAHVVLCGYQLGGGQMRMSAYWWEKRPDAPPDALRAVESGGKAVAKDGELLEAVIPIGGARTQCPDQW